MHWHWALVGELIVAGAALFCLLRDKSPVRLLAGAATGAVATAAFLVVLEMTAERLAANPNWLHLALTSLGLVAGLLGGTGMGAFAGAGVVALLEGPSPARSSAYVGALIGLAVAAVPVVFLQQAWPEEVRAPIVVALVCQGLLAGTFTGRGLGMKGAF